MRGNKCTLHGEQFACDVSNFTVPLAAIFLQLKFVCYLKATEFSTYLLWMYFVNNDFFNFSLKSLELTLIKEIQALKQEIKYQNGMMVLVNKIIFEIKDLKEKKQNENYANSVKSNEVIVVKHKRKQENGATRTGLTEEWL